MIFNAETLECKTTNVTVPVFVSRAHHTACVDSSPRECISGGKVVNMRYYIVTDPHAL